MGCALSDIWTGSMTIRNTNWGTFEATFLRACVEELMEDGGLPFRWFQEEYRCILLPFWHFPKHLVSQTPCFKHIQRLPVPIRIVTSFQNPPISTSHVCVQVSGLQELGARNPESVHGLRWQKSPLREMVKV